MVILTVCVFVSVCVCVGVRVCVCDLFNDLIMWASYSPLRLIHLRVYVHIYLLMGENDSVFWVVMWILPFDAHTVGMYSRTVCSGHRGCVKGGCP